jgi:hypothetical protein
VVRLPTICVTGLASMLFTLGGERHRLPAW